MNLSENVFSQRSWYLLPLIYLLITAIFGVLLRLLQVNDSGLNYLYILHTHSHLALLGWCNTAVVVLLTNSFIKAKQVPQKAYKRIYYCFQITVVGMLLFFPFQGYAPTTIVFSSLFLIVSYFYSYRFLKDSANQTKSIAIRFARVAILFLLLCSIGPWALGPLNVNGYGGSDLYFNAIYFYLHFLYNGWFSFAVFALFFRYLDQRNIHYKQKEALIVFRLLTISTVLAYALSVLWINPPDWVFIIGYIAIVFQLVAVFYLIRIARAVFPMLNQLNKGKGKIIFFTAVFFFLLKIVLQSVSSLPSFAVLIGEIRDWVIAYLHVVLLGFISPFLIYLFYRDLKNGVIKKLGKWGFGIFLTGFLLHEVFMFFRGFMQWSNWSKVYDIRSYLLAVTILILVGVILIGIDFFTNSQKRNTTLD